MTDPRHDQLRRLFDRALELPQAGREPFLQSQCGADAELKRRLLAMLAAADDEHFLAAPTGALPGAANAVALREGPGTRIGPYRLLQQIGEGGFGVVFLAEQEQPVARRVAFKIVKLGMDTRQVVARFEQERQALAMMDHPNIARVLDAGATDTGRPYFVMDLVKGEPIVEYCDRNNLTIDERLRLFSQVCNAVQHAHGKGIIHRDLKPTNILVGTQDGRPQAKVIDFGIAKAISQKLTDKTLFTEHQQVIGTLQYMSPEQASGSLDIDTRTDVYSLGVLLYELLTGSTPFDKKTVKDAMLGELQRMIREVEPPRPSTRLSESHELLASIAAHRRVEPRRLGVLLRGDLDWIVMKALEKDRARRYATANGLADDIGRHLAGEAVVAAPPSRSYRLRKFVRRHRGPTAAAAAVAVSLLAGVIAFAWQARVALAERDRVLAAEQQTSQVAKFQDAMFEKIDLSAAGAALADDVLVRFQATLLKAEVPDAVRTARFAAFRDEWRNVNATDVARELIDRTMLRPAVQTLAEIEPKEPIFVAQMRRTLGVRYDRLGLFDAARPLAEQAATALRQRVGPTDRETMLAIELTAMLQEQQGHFAEAEELYREVLAGRLTTLGEAHVETLRATSNLGRVAQAQGKFVEAEQFHRRALDQHRRFLGERDAHTLDAKCHLGTLLRAAGQLEEAEGLLRDVVAGRRQVLGEHRRETLDATDNLALLLADRGKLAEAEALLRSVVEHGRKTLGEEHPDTLVWRNDLATVWKTLGRIAEAEQTFREVLSVRRRRFGDDDPATQLVVSNLGLLLQEQGRPAEAEPLLREAVDTRRRVLGADDLATLTAMNNLGMLLNGLGRHGEAEALYRQALERRRHAASADDPLSMTLLNNLASLLNDAGKPELAEPIMREAMAATQRVFGPKNVNAMAAIANLGAVLRALGRFDEAESLFREALEKQRSALGAEHPSTLNTVQLLASVLCDRKPEEALALLVPLQDAMKKTFTGDNEAVVGRMLMFLGKARTRLAKSAADLTVAEQDLQAAWAIFTAARVPFAKDLRRGAQACVDLYTAWDRLEPGTGRDAKAAEWRPKLETAGK